MKAPSKKDLTANNVNSFNLIYCPDCKSIPEIQLETKEEKLLFSKVCKCQPELGKPINDFIEILFDNKIKFKICEKGISHGLAVDFCTECLKWFCPKCYKEHESSVLDHITINSKDKLDIKSLCENVNCSNKNIDFYCQNCSKNLCKKCIDEHDKNHNIIEYKDFFKNKNFLTFKANVKEVSELIDKKNLEYKKIIIYIENIIKNIKELFQKNLEKNGNLLKLYESMIDTYQLTSKFKNYQIRKSILNAFQVKDIFENDDFDIRNLLKFEAKNLNQNVAYFKKEAENISYLNLFVHDKDYIKIESIDTKNLDFKININGPDNSYKFENKNFSEFIKESMKNKIILDYKCVKHNKQYKYFCLKCKVNFCEKCKEHEAHKEYLYNLAKETAQITDIDNKKIINNLELEKINSLQNKFNEWIKEFKLKMTYYFNNIKFILHCKDEIFNKIKNKEYNYSYVLNCNYIINKLQIGKKLDLNIYQKICHILLNLVMIF